jgi:hypothetical protein
MIRLLPLVFAALMMGTSQASTQPNASPSFHKLSVGKNTTATRSVAARVLPRKQRVLQQQLSARHDCEDNTDPAGPDELDLQGPYRRPQLVEIPQYDGDISDYVAVRLAVARARALAKYRETYA